jgi:hypothetical protein
MNRQINRWLFCALAALLLSVAGRALAADQPYDPLALSGQRKIETIDFTIKDEGRRREIPLRVYLPPAIPW